MTRLDGRERTTVTQPVATAVTDRRICLTTPDDGSGAVSLGYDEVASISVTEEAVLLRTAQGTGIEWSRSDAESVSPSLCRHLDWIGDLRTRVRSCRNDVELAAGEIRELADDLAWEEAIERYREVREQLDELLAEVFCTEPVSASVLAPEVTDIERTLETAHTRLCIERAESQLELGRQLLENGDYEQGRKVLEQARRHHRRARSQRDAVERADAFQFGTQRSLTEDIEGLGWKLEAAAAEPVRQAFEAKVRGQGADDPAESVAHWERAFRRFGHVFTLEWGSDERGFAGEPATVRAELEGAASRLIDLHAALAEDAWNAGADRQAAGDRKAALECCLDARGHLERAYELAAEFSPDRADALASRLETMVGEVRRMRRAEDDGRDGPAPADAPTETPSSRTADEESSPDSGERALPSASELAEMDTHQELTLDSEDLQVRSLDVERSTREREDGSDAERTRERVSDATDGEVADH